VSRSRDSAATHLLAGSDPWEPVRCSALADAGADADGRRAQARERRIAVLASARQRAGELREDSLAAARRAADRDALGVLSEARRSAHGLLLSARRDVYAKLIRETIERASSRREDYQATAEQLIRDARRRLGEGVEIIDVPDGGIIARARGRQIDYSLLSQVERCLTELDDEVAALWS
jgi:vacuolar-type H+-ATPase subunit H